MYPIFHLRYTWPLADSSSTASSTELFLDSQHCWSTSRLIRTLRTTSGKRSSHSAGCSSPRNSTLGSWSSGPGKP